jgi:hypothetical protein
MQTLNQLTEIALHSPERAVRATAIQDICQMASEAEALRKEVDKGQTYAKFLADECARYSDRAERLEKALRDLVTDSAAFLALALEQGMQEKTAVDLAASLAYARAALAQEKP